MNVTFVDERDDPRSTIDVPALAELVLRRQDLPTSTEVSIVLVDRTAMAERNERFMGEKGPTDVLAFPIEDLTPGQAVAWPDSGPPFLLGDVFICPDVVGANAEAAGVLFEDEMSLMVVHGLLHLMGFDHQEDADAALMESRERELLALIGRTRP